MNLKNGMPSAVIFLAASIILLSSATLANNVFAQTEGEEESTSMSTSTSSNYESFQNCLSDASGQYSAPTGDQIVNCFAASGYVQGSSSTSNAEDKEDGSEKTKAVVDDESEDGQTENVQVNVVDHKDNQDDDHDDHDDDHDEDEDDE